MYLKCTKDFAWDLGKQVGIKKYKKDTTIDIDDKNGALMLKHGYCIKSISIKVLQPEENKAIQSTDENKTIKKNKKIKKLKKQVENDE